MGLVLPEPVNAKMLKGKELEPIALEDFNSAAIIDFKPAVIQSDQYPWMACSLDGATISSDNEIMEIVEIKCSKYCYDSISKQKDIPVNYRYQMNHQMLCCELDYCYYYAYWNGQGIIYCTNRDETIIKDILEKGYDFWKGLTNLEIPEGCNET
jgi:putative phage-type endonuclease